MFERFTREARTVAERAVLEAQALGADHVFPEHLVLAVAACDGAGGRALDVLGRDAQALRTDLAAWEAAALTTVGVDPERLGAALGAAGAQAVTSRHLPFSSGSKRVLERSLRAALGYGHKRIDSGHILLGLVTDPDRPTLAMLRRLGLEPGAVRRAVEEAWQADIGRAG